MFSLYKKMASRGKFHYEGDYVIKGVEINSWGDVVYYISFISRDNQITMKMGLSHRENLNTVFPDHYGHYSKAYYCSIGNDGINIRDLPEGLYKIKIILCKQGVIYEEDTGDYLDICNGFYTLK